MAIDYTKQTFTFTDKARMVWVHLLAPKSYTPKSGTPGKPKYYATFLLPGNHPDLAGLKALIVSTWRDAYGDRPINPEILPIKSGTQLADAAVAKGKNQEFLRGMVVFNTASPRQPILRIFKADGTREPLDTPEKLTLNGGQFYSGVYAAPSVVINAYSDVGSKGINAYLNTVVSFNSGERMGGASHDPFDKLTGHVSNENPMGDDVNIPL